MRYTERGGIRHQVAAAAILILLLPLASQCRAQQPGQKEPGTPPLERVTGYRPALPETSPANPHPLAAVIEYARQEQNYLLQTVHDFTCRLVKRERIGNFLQEMHYVDMQVREGLYDGRRVVRPLSIYLHFLGPRDVAGRRVLYIEGQNDGKLAVRNGGRHFDYVVVNIDPDGENARDETLVPITEIGFNQLLGKMIDVLDRHQRIDPNGENTKAERIAGAKINERPCTVIRVTHPRPMDGLEFHVANVFVDDELHAPVRIDYSSWPKRPGAAAPLIAEYTYTNLKLNVNLPDATFTRARLRGQGD